MPEIREKIARIEWTQGHSDTGWETSHNFAHKTGLPYVIADQILSIPELTRGLELYEKELGKGEIQWKVA